MSFASGGVLGSGLNPWVMVGLGVASMAAGAALAAQATKTGDPAVAGGESGGGAVLGVGGLVVAATGTVLGLTEASKRRRRRS